MLKRIIYTLLIVLNLGINARALEISAKSAILYEPITNTVVFEKNAQEKLPMASTTKIITAITAIENGNLSDVVITSKRAAEVEGSSVWLAEGEKQTLENLVYGLMLSSGNDAAIAIAEHIGGYDKFVDKMNELAKKAGATNTSLKNPNGLDEEGHFTTALDMAKISAYAMKNEKFRQIVSTKEKVIPWEGHQWGRTLKNHNKMLRMYDGTEGIKTGFTKKDGRCLVTSAARNGVRLICVTLNAPDDWNDHKKLLDMGFSVYKGEKIVLDDKTVTVSNGEEESVTLKPERNVILPFKDGDKTNIRYIIEQKISAPVAKGKVVGFAEIYINQNLAETVNYIVDKSVKEIKKITLRANFSKLLCQLLN